MKKIKNKNTALITSVSILACALHAVMLNSPFNFYVYTSAVKVILFILTPAVYFAVSKGGGFKEMFSRGNKEKVKRSFMLCFCVFAFILLLAAVLSPWLDREQIIGGLEHNGITGGTFPFVFAYIVLVNAALEEVFFRGFVFYTLYRSGLKRYAYAFSCLLFAFYHAAILGDWVSPGIFIFFMLGLSVAGLIFNELTRRCECLTGSLAVHMGANIAINLVVVYYLYF
ncbi:MAG: CPBP family glutamic-type intramembrane protease [Oscillospiraceae bacterium]|nr:CPBP family glutamic-type intramembrane protease [Oscillospiraceae bacterium]